MSTPQVRVPRGDPRSRTQSGPQAAGESPVKVGTSNTTVALGYLPTSFNRTAHAHWRVAHRAKQQLQADLELVLLAAGIPRSLPGPVVATAVLTVPDRRRRDEGNFRTPLEKALGDALVNGRWLDDDTPAHFRFGALTFEHEPRQRSTQITLSWPGRLR